MCDILIPAIIGIAALGALSGGIGGGSSTVTIPQQVGDVTNGVPVYSAAQPYGGQPAFGAAQPSYGYAAPAPAPYGAPAPAGYAAGPGYSSPYAAQAGPAAPYGYAGQSAVHSHGPDVGASVNVGGQSALGAGAYAGDGGVGLGANVGGLDAGIGIGSQSY
jgi:hypothetical protein